MGQLAPRHRYGSTVAQHELALSAGQWTNALPRHFGKTLLIVWDATLPRYLVRNAPCGLNGRHIERWKRANLNLTEVNKRQIEPAE